MLGNSSYIVLGEASESEEDETHEQTVPTGLTGSETVAVCEASESESEFYEDCDVAVEAFKAKAEEARYNSLLHKKLFESNFKLKDDLKQLVTDNLKSTTDQVSQINQKLLCNQVEIQDTVKYLKKSSVAVNKVDNILSYLLTQNFLPSINIEI